MTETSRGPAPTLALVAVPAVLGLLLATASLLVRRRRPSLANGLGTAGVVAAGLPVILVTDALIGW